MAQDFTLRGFRPVTPGLGEGLATLGEALRYRQKREQEEKAAAEYRRQNDLNERRQGANEDRARLEYETRMADRNSGIAEKVLRKTQEGDLSGARAFAGSSRIVDPRTGQLKTIAFDPGEEKTAPSYDQIRDGDDVMEPGESEPGIDKQDPYGQPPQAGGLLSRLGASARAGQHGTAATGDQVGAPGQYNGLAQMMRPQAKPQRTNPAFVMPDGTRMEIDPEESARFKQRKADLQRERLLGMMSDPTIPPDVKRSIALQAGLAGAQATGAQSAAVGGRDSQEDSQQFQAGQRQQYDLTADQKAEIARRRGAGKARGPGAPRLDKTDDLDVLDKAGNKIGMGRTAPESTTLRQQRTVLAATDKTAKELKDHLAQYGNISTTGAIGAGAKALFSGDSPVEAFQGSKGQQAVRDQLIDRLVAARKEITGAMNESDVERYKKQFDTAFSRGPEAAQAAVDSFTRELDNLYDEKTKSVMSKPMAGRPGASASAATPPGQTKRLKSGKTARFVGPGPNDWEIVD
jgi:hypothetical protein